MNERARAGKNQQRPAGLGARNRPVAINILAALTGSASGDDRARSARRNLYAHRGGAGHKSRIDAPVAAIGFGTLDSLPHNGAVVTLLAVCGSTHRESYLDIVMVGIVSALIALVAVIALGSMFGSF